MRRIFVFVIAFSLILVGGLFFITACSSTPQISLSTLTISPQPVTTNSPVTISINVLNYGDKPAEYLVHFKVNDTEVTNQNASLAGGETKTISFQYTPETRGSYSIDINGQTGSFEALTPAHITTGALKITPASPAIGEAVQISTDLSNDGDLEGAFAAKLKVNGKETDSKDYTVGPGKTETASASYTTDKNGTYTIEYCGLTQEIKVLKPADIGVTKVTVSPDTMITGDTAVVSAVVTNTGDVKGTVAAPLLVDGTQKDSQEVTLEAGASTTLDFNVQRDTSGTCEVSVLGTKASLKVIALSKYTNKSFYYQISYPPDMKVTDTPTTKIVNISSNDNIITIDVLADFVSVTESPKQYFDIINGNNKVKYSDWSITDEKEIKEGDAVIGYRFNFSNTVSGEKRTGAGLVMKKAGYGYNVSCSTKASTWEKNKGIATHCLDSFSPPKSFSGSYSNSVSGLSLTLPKEWSLMETGNSLAPMVITSPYSGMFVAGTVTLENVATSITAQQYLTQSLSATPGVTITSQAPFTFANSVNGYEVSGSYLLQGMTLNMRSIAVANGNRMYTFSFISFGSALSNLSSDITQICKTAVFSTPAAAGSVNRNESLVLMAGEIPTMDPAVTEDAADDPIGTIFSGLTKIDKDMKVVPDLAESWTVSTDGLTYTFKIRANAKFHDGKAVTAQDVKYSWERACDPKVKSAKASYFLNDIVGAADRLAGKSDHIEGLKAIDDHTLQVVLTAPKQYFLAKLTQPVTYIVDRANVEKGSSWWEQPNGTGPFKLKTWQKDDQMVVERNDNYYLTPAKLKNVVFKMYSGNPMTLYESGDIDISIVTLYDQARVLDTASPLNKQLLTANGLDTTWVGLNVTKAPFDDPKVREAFAMALDVNKLIEITMKGRAVRATGYLPSGMPGFDSTRQPFKYDPQQAKQLIAQSKYGSVDKLPAITMYVYMGASSVDQAIIGMWQQNLGVKVNVETVSDITTYMERMRNAEFQVFFSGWGADYLDPQNFLEVLFQSQSSENSLGYNNPAADAALAKAGAEPDEDARIKAYQDIETLILNDLPAIPLWSNTKNYMLVKPYVKGYVLTSLHVNIWTDLEITAH